MVNRMVKNPQTEQIEIFFEDEEPTYSSDGVDLSLIRWMLSLSPKERLEYLQQNIKTIIRLRGGQTSN